MTDDIGDDKTIADIAEARAKKAKILNEDDMATLLAEKYKDQFRYINELDLWVYYDAKGWHVDRNKYVFDCVVESVRVAIAALNARERKSMLMTPKIKSIIYMLGARRRISMLPEQFDADPYLLGTPDGVVELKTGQLRDHKPLDYITKRTSITPKKIPIPLWDAFFNRFTNGDADLKIYLQKLCGYYLSGVINRQEFYFFYGQGANGKGVFTQTLIGIIADYHTQSNVEAFTEQHIPRHLTELARLAGARLVTVTEVPENKKWDMGRIKQITGGEKVTANYMRQNHFEYAVQYKLHVQGNHQPTLGAIDESVRRRVRQIKCNAVIPPAQRDEDLPEKLKVEWPGILQWMIDGCVMWQQQGLKPPPIVIEASEEYLEAVDTFGSWLSECCTVTNDPIDRVQASDLYENWKIWSERNGVKLISSNAFGRLLTKKFKRLKSDGVPYCLGVRFKTTGSEAPL